MAEVGGTTGLTAYSPDSSSPSVQQVDFSFARAAYTAAIKGAKSPEERHAEIGLLSGKGTVSFARLGKDEEYGAHRVGSVSKTFTTFLALTLVNKRLFPDGLETKCGDVLPEDILPKVFEDVDSAKNMTLGQLLSHTSGLEFDDHCYKPYQNIPSLKPATLQDRFLQESTREAGRKYKYITKPGDGIGFYSNAGLAVACWMIEAAYSKDRTQRLPFSEIMKRELFENVFELSDSFIAPGPSGDIIQSGAGDMSSTTFDLMKVAKRLQMGEGELEKHFGQGWQSTMLKGRDIFEGHGLGCEANAPVIKHFGMNRERFGSEERDVTAVVEFPLNKDEPGLVAMCDSSALGPGPEEQKFIKTLEMAAGITPAVDAERLPKYELDFFCPPNAFLFQGNGYLATNVDPFTFPETIIASRNGMKHELTRFPKWDREGITGYEDENKNPWLFITKDDGRRIIYSPLCLLTKEVKGIDVARLQPETAQVQALKGMYRNAEKPDEHPTFIFTEQNGHLYMREANDKESFPCLFIPDEAGGSWVPCHPYGPTLSFRFPPNPDEGYLIISDIFTGVQQLPDHCKRVPT